MTELVQERQLAHAYLDKLPPAQLSAIRNLLESILDPVSLALSKALIDDEEVGEEEKQAVARSKEWFRHNQGVSFEDVVAECGFTMDQIQSHKEQT